MFKEASWIKKEIIGAEYNFVIEQLLQNYSREEISSINQTVAWKLYDMYAGWMSVEKRKNLSDRELISFVDTSFTYEYFKDKLVLKMRYGIQELSNKPFIIKDTKKIYFPSISDNDVKRKIKNELRVLANYNSNDSLKINSCFDGSFSIWKKDNLISEMKSNEHSKIFVDDIKNNIPEILLQILGMREGDSRSIPLNETTKANINVEKIYEVSYPKINKETIEKMNIFNVENEKELFETMKKQLALNVIQKSIKSYLEYLAPRSVFDNNIDINPDYVEGFYAKDVLKEHGIAIEKFNDFQTYLKYNELTEEQFHEKVKKSAVDKACIEIFINEVCDKYIYQQDNDLFEYFKKEIINSYKTIGRDITQDQFFNENIKITFLHLEVFLTVIKITNPKVYEERIKGKKFPYII
ncbi:hypothetical protein [Mycoplasma phocimorsus]|uniref:hypothetical protein n=1 Tax=Mycoplasma phocimorsus TaxID=3045839 RepID=UPI0024C0C452|nr:hypothetical protein [Mycoplasma phocimorsus]MDJ1647175.1 hypothetical protein [Mycoplasma phocimorsus]